MLLWAQNTLIMVQNILSFNERQRWRIRFLDRARRTSLRRRRWFQIGDIEPDSVARERLIGLWRASIYNSDLVLNGKSQVLCLSASPLLNNYRLPSELARGEHFNMIIGDLWMSAPRWIEWFRQIGQTAPHWLITCTVVHREEKATPKSPTPATQLITTTKSKAGAKARYDWEDINLFVDRELDR
jgi:hypothetical protein